MKKKIITRIAVCAVLAALYFVFDLISIKAGPFKLSVSGLPIIIVAVIYGPIDGMIVGFTGAFLGQLLTYGFTPTTLLWVLPAVLRGLIVGLCFRKQNVKNHPIKLIFVILISSLIVTTTNTFAMYVDSVIYNYYSYAYIFGALLYRYIAGILTGFIYTVLTPVIYEQISKILNVTKEKELPVNNNLQVVFYNLSIIFGIISLLTCFVYYISLIFAVLGIICSLTKKTVKENKGFKYSMQGLVLTLTIIVIKLILGAFASYLIQFIIGLLAGLL